MDFRLHSVWRKIWNWAASKNWEDAACFWRMICHDWVNRIQSIKLCQIISTTQIRPYSYQNRNFHVDKTSKKPSFTLIKMNFRFWNWIKFLKLAKNMNFIFCKLKKPQKTWISFFASSKVKKTQKTWIKFLQA